MGVDEVMKGDALAAIGIIAFLIVLGYVVFFWILPALCEQVSIPLAFCP